MILQLKMVFTEPERARFWKLPAQSVQPLQFVPSECVLVCRQMQAMILILPSSQVSLLWQRSGDADALLAKIWKGLLSGAKFPQVLAWVLVLLRREPECWRSN